MYRVELLTCFYMFKIREQPSCQCVATLCAIQFLIISPGIKHVSKYSYLNSHSVATPTKLYYTLVARRENDMGFGPCRTIVTVGSTMCTSGYRSGMKGI
jgi:hypothetical protein